MTLPPTDLDAGERGEWVLVQPGWWRTPFSSVSWTYSLPQKQLDSKQHVSNGFSGYAKPPHYHGSLFRVPGPASGVNHSSPDASPPRDQLDRDDVRIYGEGNVLNPDLVGVRGATEVVSSYEIDVGFYYPGFSDSAPDERETKDPAWGLCAQVDEDEMALNKGRWDDLVQSLTGDFGSDEFVGSEGDESHEGLYSSPHSSAGGLHRSTSTLSSIDLTDSEHSTKSVSMPSTPKPKSSYANIVVKNVSPASSTSSSSDNRRSHAPSPPRRLNASASSFVPSFPPPTKGLATPNPIPTPDVPAAPPVAIVPAPPAFTNFTFPSLDLQIPALPNVKIKKDEQGFYTEIEVSPPQLQTQGTSERASSALLPPFLHEPLHRRSRTRAIVDQLRSSSNQCPEGFGEGLGLGNMGMGAKSKSTSHSPSPSPSFYDPNFFQPRLSVSEDGGDRDSCLSIPSAEDDEDGWIGLSEAEAEPQAKMLKARRTRDLFRALSRHRGNSTSSEESKNVPSSGLEDNVVISSVEQLCASPSPSPSPPSPAPSSNDGWIEGSSLVQPQPQPQNKPPINSAPKKSHSQNPSARPGMPPPSSSSSYSSHRPHLSLPPLLPPPTATASQYATATPYLYPSYPAMPMPMPYAAYMQLQMQMQLQLQMQMQGGVGTSGALAPVGGTGEWSGFPIPNACAPRFIPSVPSSSKPAATPMVIPMNIGPSGIKHTMW